MQPGSPFTTRLTETRRLYIVCPDDFYPLNLPNLRCHWDRPFGRYTGAQPLVFLASVRRRGCEYGNIALGYVLGPGGMWREWGGVGWRAMFVVQPSRREGIVIVSNSERGDELSNELF